MANDIKFYSLNKDEDKSINIDNSLEFSKAVNSVIEKDILSLDKKLKEIVKSINKILITNSVIIDYKLNDKIENIDNTINDVEDLISNLIVKKGSIKIGIFSSKKKQKKLEINSIENSLEKIHKKQNNIIVLKNEYVKLVQRINDIKNK